MRKAEALLVAQLHMGSSRAAELEARTSEIGGRAETEEEPATGRSTGRPVDRPRLDAEP